MQQEKINVLVFLQTNSKRILVGKLWKETNQFKFAYDGTYLNKPNILPLGPDLPLQINVATSKKLFESFKDRIPSKHNPQYEVYCQQWGISPDESDELILLTTIGSRGPSSFLFRREIKENFSGKDLKEFREAIGLSLADFATLVESEPATISRTESDKLKSHLLLSFCELLKNSKDALAKQLDKRGMFLHDSKIELIKNYIQPSPENTESAYAVEGQIIPLS